MADRLRRAKDVLNKNISDYLKMTSNRYTTYFEGSPTYITYYQLDSLASLEDGTLETVHSLVGANTPKKYKKIKSVPVWGVDTLDVSNQLSERGLEATITGELLFIPDSVRPYPGDFFIFEYEGLDDHLFKINDVQYDKISPKKFFRCQYSIFPNNAEIILENISDEYECIFDDSNGTTSIIKTTENASIENIKSISDKMVDRFEKLFYDEETDTFICKDLSNENGIGYFWSPYLQHFMASTKVLNKYTDEILTEFYVMDIGETDNPEIFNNQAYFDSLFRAVEIQNNDVNFDMNFLCSAEYDLKCTRNLPFFMSNRKFKLLSPIVHENQQFPYLNAFPIFFPENAKLFKDVDHFHKVHAVDMAHLARLEEYLNEYDIIYCCPQHELEPTEIYRLTPTEENGKTYIDIIDVSIEQNMEKPKTELPFLFNIIREYLNNTLVVNDELIEKLNRFNYKNNVINYIFMPLIIYILKEQINK